MARQPVSLSAPRAGSSRRRRIRRAHDAILKEFGFKAIEIAALRKTNVI